ncbi:MAG: Abi family protein [Mycoplasmoidaceae bacterium]
MKSINNILSIEEQIENLKKSGLKFVDEDSTKKFSIYLIEYNYEILINGYWFDEFYNDEGKEFSEYITSDDIRYLFDIDRTISSIIWKYFKGVELYFNALITTTLCKAFEEHLDGPYVILLDEESVKKIFGNFPPKKDNKNKENPNSSHIKKILLGDANREKWFDYLVENNRESENKKIIKKIDLVLKSEKNKKNSKYALVHLKALSSCWTFSKVKDIYKWLSDDLRNSVIKDFFKHLNINKDIDLEDESIALIELLEKFSDFRNTLAHNSKIIDWKLEINSEKLAETFSLVINEKIFKKEQYNISYIVRIVQGIKKMENNEILKEIEEYIFKKNESSKKLISQITKDIIKSNVNIKME